MQQLSCSATLLGIVLMIIALFVLGISSASQPTFTQPKTEQTADAIRATNVQIEIFLSQTQQAPIATSTPVN